MVRYLDILVAIDLQDVPSLLVNGETSDHVAAVKVPGPNDLQVLLTVVPCASTALPGGLTLLPCALTMLSCALTLLPRASTELHGA